MNVRSLSLQKNIRMARPVRNRKICSPPVMKGFKPFGLPLCELKKVVLQIDEYESIKLVNYLNLPQDQAAERMNVSRPTFTRIYNSALRKLAQALVEGHAVEFAGGPVEFDRDWYQCRKCHRLIEGLENHVKCADCDAFQDEELVLINP